MHVKIHGKMHVENELLDIYYRSRELFGRRRFRVKVRDKLLLNVLNRLAILPPIDRLVALLAFRSTETVSPAWDLFDMTDQQAIHVC